MHIGTRVVSLLARNPRALTAVGLRARDLPLAARARRAGRARSTASGAVCFPQRFGGSLNLNVHYQVATPDGVFTAAKGATRADFWRLPAPDGLGSSGPLRYSGSAELEARAARGPSAVLESNRT
jgi:hypothetical protein